MGLGPGVGRDRPQLARVDDPDPAALHLLEEDAAPDRPQEQDDLDRLDVGAGADHVHRDGDARLEAVAERLDEVARLRAGHLAGDLLAEGVAAAELVADDLDDVLGVAVVLGEDQRLGDFRPARKEVGEEPVAERADDGADLVAGDDAAVELAGVVGDVVVGPFPAAPARLPVAVLDHRVGRRLDGGALAGDPGADVVDLEVDVDAVGDRAPVVVLHHQVLVEEPEGLLRRRRGEPDEEGVEVLQHLPPDGVDGAVAFVDDDDVEVLRRAGRVVDDRQRFARRRGGRLELRRRLVVRRERGLALQHRIEALDRGDDHLAGRADRVRRQPLDGVQLGEPAVVVRGAEALELLLGLLAEVAPVDEEQHAARAGVADEAVDRRDGGDRLAGAGGHLDQRARMAAPERPLQVGHRLDLRGIEEVPFQRRQRSEARAQRRRARVARGGVEAGPSRSQALHPGVERLRPEPVRERLRPVRVREV